MTQDEIIEMAKEAGLSNPLWIENDYEIIKTFASLVKAKATAKEALAQQEQEYESVLIDGVAYTIPSKVAVEILGLHLDLLQLKQKQEPVAWMYQEYRDDDQFGWRDEILFTPPPNDPIYFRNITPVYTIPQRTWVGLTDEERSELVTLHHGWNEYGQAIEAKLKQKNGYAEEKNT
jgi:hypothetical protein